MKKIGYYPAVFLLMWCCSSCVGVKKYKALEAQNEKITATLLETKEELSTAKRNLNKLEDKSSSNLQEMDASMESLQIRLQESLAQLKASQAQLQSLKQQSSAQREQFNLQSSNYEAQLKPYLAAQSTLQKEQSNLSKLYLAIEEMLAQDSLAQVSMQLLPAKLVVTFEQGYLFGGSERTVSSAAKKNLEQLAALMQQYPTMHLDILGHMASSSDALGTWKSSTRKPLVVLYTLLKAGAAPKNMRLVAYSQYAPLMPGNSREAAAKNARTELVFHYQAERFVPTLVQP